MASIVAVDDVMSTLLPNLSQMIGWLSSIFSINRKLARLVKLKNSLCQVFYYISVGQRICQRPLTAMLKAVDSVSMDAGNLEKAEVVSELASLQIRRDLVTKPLQEYIGIENDLGAVGQLSSTNTQHEEKTQHTLEALCFLSNIFKLYPKNNRTN
ncbi:hypothetical protein BDF20DRAFT_840150 [Mycotypha africana]|uniref:uncharacterized protein n=1 Tax=Mycotypha africana TaxID=64632 RepID=UPI0022FFE534|nr:uncharacterized protein BDF20DRAFT_840150 [Mycotypha africana]KAI8967607.1 hypothetical protein BDF20DRAFT_840150 [Mycotypha africana]